MIETKDTYLTLAGATQGLYKEKGSRFISFGFPVSSEEEALEIVKNLKDKYHDARHHCWAYRLGLNGETYRVNDDGEPSGTAGRPIHGVMMSKGLTNALFVVVRYFGGIKLGTSGLIDAYKTATEDAVSSASTVERQVMKEISFTYQYEQIGKIMKTLKSIGADITENEMNIPCRMKIVVRAAKFDGLIDTLRKNESVVVF